MKRDVVKLALDARAVPYVPWHCTCTEEVANQLRHHFNVDDLDSMLGNHFLYAGSCIGVFTDIENNRVQDIFGVVWNREVDKDIGVVEGHPLETPTLKGYQFPDPCDDRIFHDVADKLQTRCDCFRVFPMGFSLYERAWTLRGMENLMIDFIENPAFVKDLLRCIADYNIAQIKMALQYDIDGVYMGDDWGQQTGLQMGGALWREFVKPELVRIYAEVRNAGKYVMIHSCGKVDELFDDLVDIGVNCFNPFQPEVMDVLSLMDSYQGRLAFHGGLSTQRTLPYGNVDEVVFETQRLLAAGKKGGYIFAPAHAVEDDVPIENILAFVKVLHDQEGYIE